MKKDQDKRVSRSGFFGEIMSFLRQGIGEHVDRKLGKMLDGPIRPPGALDEVTFLSTCTRCNRCVEVCPHHAIQKMPLSAGVAANSPYIDPEIQPCHLCEDYPCIQACNDQALLPLSGTYPHMGRAMVDETACITFEEKVCTLCYDVCPLPERAIQIDENFHPRVLDGCVGCGLCQQRCPVTPKGVRAYSHLRYRALEVGDDPFGKWLPAENEESDIK